MIEMSEGETPAGFPGQDRDPIELDEGRMARALSVFDRLEDAEPAEEPAPEDGAGEPAGDDTEAAADAAEAPPPSHADAEPSPPPPTEPAPELAAALSKISEMTSALEQRLADVAAREAEQEKVREKLERFERFEAKASKENFLAAAEELGWDADKLTQAIVQGRGVRSPQDDAREMVEQVRTEMQRELEQLRAVQREREVEETRSLVLREVSSPDAAPLVAAFGAEGVAAVLQEVESATLDGKRVPRDQAVRAAVESIETKLRDRFLTVALKNEGVRKKYADLLGIRESASPVTSGRPLSNRSTSTVARRAEQETLTDEERFERAARLLK